MQKLLLHSNKEMNKLAQVDGYSEWTLTSLEQLLFYTLVTTGSLYSSR